MPCRIDAPKKAILVACLLSASVPTNVLADSAASPPSKAPTLDAATRTKMALKLAGLVAFVASSCPKLKPDYVRFKSAISAFGLSVQALDKPDMKNGYLAYTVQYRTDIPGNCGRATDQFGPRGATIPGIFQDAPH